MKNIHQTEEAANFNASIPVRGKTWWIDLENGRKALAVRYKLPKGFSWLYCPRGPILDEDSSNIKKTLSALLNGLKGVFKSEKSIFLRIDPMIEANSNFAKDFHQAATSLGFHPVDHGFQPQHTLIVDLTLSEEEILKQMKQKGRYNIKVAEKGGVKIRIADLNNKTQFSQDLDAFYNLLTQTTTRDKFHGHNQEYYESMLKHLGPKAKLYLAENKSGQIIAAAINTYHGDTATYYYGVSGNQDRNLMAPYLLHWTAMRDAKNAAFREYDFFGIAPPNSPSHAWAGVTDFKKKFGGQEIAYLPAYEKPLRPLLYWLYRLYKKLR